MGNHLPAAVLAALPHSTSLRCLQIQLRPFHWGQGSDEAVEWAGLPFEALAALPSLGTLEELSVLMADEYPGVRWDLVDGRAQLLAKRR